MTESETEKTETSTQSPTPSASRTSSQTQTAEPIVLETRIRLQEENFGDDKRKDLLPIKYDHLSTDQQEIIDAAITGYEYSVTYRQSEGVPEVDKTEDLESLIRLILDRLEKQTRQFETETGTESVPEYVDRVYLSHMSSIYCIDLVDGDQRYYSC